MRTPPKPGSCALLVLALLAPTVVAAQDADARSRAAEHFRRGIELFDEERWDAALAELEAAHEIAPTYHVLYNIGLVHAALGHAVEAADALGRYLEEGAARIDPARRARVEEELARQRARIGTVRVEVNVDGATVSLDGADVGRAPIVVRVAAGSHALGVRAPGYEDATRSVSVAGGVEREERFELRPDVARGLLRITISLRGVEVLLDERSIGTTPILDAIPLPAGTHELVARRAGYLEERQRFEVVAGGEREVRIALRVDPNAMNSGEVGRLRLRLPAVERAVRIDGEPVVLQPEGLLLPPGPHSVRVEAVERQPWEGEVDLRVGGETELAPPLSWTDDARMRRLGSASELRALGWTGIIAGTVLTIVAVPLLIWNVSRFPERDALWASYDECRRTMMIDTPQCPSVEVGGGMRALELEVQAVALSNEIDAFLIGSGAGLGLGLAALVTGVGALLLAPDEDAIDAGAHVSLGPAGARVRGWF